MESLGELVAMSSLYETAPVGGPEQGDYVNAVAVLRTKLDARELLDGLLLIEQTQGRERRERWGPRTIDLDLVLYGDCVIDEQGLTVPHPHLTDRRFVLEPLLEVRPNAALPDGSPLAKFLEGTLGQQLRRLSFEL